MFCDVRLLLLSFIMICNGDAFAYPSKSLRDTNPLQIQQLRSKRHHTPSSILMSSDAVDMNQDVAMAAESQQQKSKLTREFFTIAVPAFFQLAAEPLAGLVDTAYLGRLGPEVLGGAGVAISAQYAMSKLYNDPLLRTSISLVASEDGKAGATNDEAASKSKSQALSIAVSSALLLAFTVGMIQLVLYFGFASAILRGMGVSSSSSMYYSAFCKFEVILLKSITFLVAYAQLPHIC